MNTTDSPHFSVHAHHCEVGTDLRRHFEEKITRLERLWPKLDDAHVRATEERGRYVVEVTVISGGMITRGEDRADNLRQAFDKAINKLERQLKRYKKKLESKQRRHDNRDDESGSVIHPTLSDDPVVSLANAEAPAPPADDDNVVRIKRFDLKPMSVHEATLQMDLLGHAFFVFSDSESDQVSVVYKRRDGSYGLIQPSRVEAASRR